jgi:hypothetical protein
MWRRAASLNTGGLWRSQHHLVSSSACDYALVPNDDDLRPRPVWVRGPDGDAEWTLVPTRADRDWTFELVGPGRTWTGTGGNCFSALRDLRTKLDADQLLIGLNGARPDCGVSGMLADMGEGRSVYVLDSGATGRPEMVRTLDPAPLQSVGTVGAQDALKEGWLAARVASSTPRRVAADRFGASSLHPAA